MSINRNVNSKILIIDDEEQNILFLETLLVEAGFTNVFSVMDSREAVSWFRNLQPDIVLLDLSMPYRTGIEVMGDLDAEFPKHAVPILVLTADATRTSKHLALSLGATDYLSKPLDTIEVLLRVNNLLELRAGHVLLEERVRDRTVALERTMDELATAQQEAFDAYQVKDRFLANMSHEIRTPINGIIGLCSLMADETEDEDLAGKLNLVMTSGRLLAEFMDDILSNSTDSPGELSDALDEIQLWELVQESIALHEPMIALKELQVQVNEPENGIPLIWSREALLRQAVTVVVSHSVKHTQVGSIEIDLGWERVDKAVKVSILVRDSSLGAISVTSQALRAAGKGEPVIDPDNEFDLGFGLQNARRCLERIGGTLTISSSPVVGSQYLMSLVTPEYSESGSEPGVSGRKPKFPNVLLVDDTKINALVAGTLMERLGWTVTHVNDGAEAVKAFPLRDYSLVLMDIQMPVMGGVEAAGEIGKLIAANGSVAEIVAFTANGSANDIALYKSVGMKHLLRKPITIDSLRELLTTLDLVF